MVLVVADGLRAESFFDQDCGRTKFLKETLLTKGMIGISHTRVPTESRPGHVALIAGVYEDPSSIFKGWKENAVEFDSVFNRSYKTFAWGSPDIVPMFSKGASPGRVIIDTYNSDKEVFSVSAHTYLLDKWVFDKFKVFLSNSETVQKLKEESRVIFFLHLLGLDTSGHIHKPHSQRFSDNLKYVDRGISQIVKLFEDAFDDDETAFIFTSDHGMTNRGSHGSGHNHETETPFLAWGSGINYWKPASDDFVTRNYVTIDGEKIPRYDIQQADVAPLISTLLGIPVPTNSFGKLPYMYPNVSKVYLANAFANNAYQLHAMYTKLHHQSQQRTFHFSFNLREKKIEDEILFLDEQIRLSFTIKDYDDIIIKSNNMISAIYDGIDFYQMYYKNELLVALTFSMLGWIALLSQYIATSNVSFKINRKVFLLGGFTSTVIVAFNLLQHAPLVVIGYFLLPIGVWMIVLSNNDNDILQKFMRNKNQLLAAIACVTIAEMLVFSFFQRKILSLMLLGYVGAITAFAIKKKLQPKLKILKYFSSAVCLGIFPLLKVVEKDTKNSILL
jgi:GPI ethanolamine phosphate transferase 1